MPGVVNFLPGAGPAPSAGPAAGFRAVGSGAVGMPLYRAVKRALLQALAGGSIAPGQALPNERDLAAAFGVSIGTLRHAVDELVAEHILVRRQGLGTFAATHTPDRFLFQFFHVERRDGLREPPQVELLSFGRERLDDEDAAQALGLRVGDAVLCIDNRLLLQGRAVIHDRIRLPAALFRGLTEKRFRDRPSTIYHLYQAEFGITVVRVHERAVAVAAGRTESRLLGVPAGMPLLQVRRTALGFGDKPVEYRVSAIDTTRHDYVSLLSRPA
jgi:GntR family transcriptional regulator